MANESCNGSFSFIMSAEWDYVKHRQIKKYLNDKYGVSAVERMNLYKALKMLLDSGKWEPMDDVSDITTTGSDKVFWDGRNGFCPCDDEHQPDETKKHLYNEYLYFTSKVRPLIYNMNRERPDKEDHYKAYLKYFKKNNRASVVLSRILDDKSSGRPYYILVRAIIPKDPDFQILQPEGADREKPEFQVVHARNQTCQYLLYKLPINYIQLRLYATGVLSLAFCCNDELDASRNEIRKFLLNDLKELTVPETLSGTNPSESLPISENDIAWIMNAGRRFYWPRDTWKPVNSSNFSDMPVYSCLSGVDSGSPIVICNYRSLIDTSFKQTITKPEHISWVSRLVSDSCISIQALRYNADKRKVESDDRDTSSQGNLFSRDLLVWDIFNDERMYIIGTIVSSSCSREISEAWKFRRQINISDLEGDSDSPACVKSRQLFSGLRKWYGIMALDADWNDSSCQDYDMLLTKTEESTDPRWVRYDTMYAVRYNAFIQLLSEFAPSYLSRNMDWMYYQMFLLGIMQRSVLQRFYREASGTAISRRRSKASKLSADLQEKYILFLNRMWFSEVTEQEQGDDLFSRLQDNMELEYDKELLDSVLDELASQHSKTLNDAINYLLLPLSIVTVVLDALTLFISFEDVNHILDRIPINIIRHGKMILIVLHFIFFISIFLFCVIRYFYVLLKKRR